MNKVILPYLMLIRRHAETPEGCACIFARCLRLCLRLWLRLRLRLRLCLCLCLCLYVYLAVRRGEYIAMDISGVRRCECECECEGVGMGVCDENEVDVRSEGHEHGPGRATVKLRYLPTLGTSR